MRPSPDLCFGKTSFQLAPFHPFSAVQPTTLLSWGLDTAQTKAELPPAPSIRSTVAQCTLSGPLGTTFCAKGKVAHSTYVFAQVPRTVVLWSVSVAGLCGAPKSSPGPTDVLVRQHHQSLDSGSSGLPALSSGLTELSARYL